MPEPDPERMQLHPLYERLHHAINAMPPGPGQDAARTVVDRHGPAHWHPQRPWVTCSECAILAWPPPNDPNAMWSDVVYPCPTTIDLAQALHVTIGEALLAGADPARRINALIAASSLGTAEALLLRAQTGDAVAARILERANQYEAEGTPTP